MTDPKLTVFGFEIKDAFYHIILVFIGQRMIHGDAQAVVVIMLCHWEIAFFKTKLFVIRHQMARHIMHLRKNVFCSQVIIQSQSVVGLNNIEMIGISGL